MARRSVTVSIPHQLGKAEARRRIDDGFGRLRDQLAGGLAGVASFDQRWEGDRLVFEGTSLAQKVAGRLDVLEDEVRIELDLPSMLAAIAQRLGASIRTEGQRLLEKK